MPKKTMPTLVQLIDATLGQGCDQTAIVRPPVGLSPAGLAVLLLGDKAVKKIGGAFLTFARQERLGDPMRLSEIDFQRPVDPLFDWLEQVHRGADQRRWAYGIFWLDQAGGARLRCAVCVASGTDLCTRLARELTSRGLPVTVQ